MARFWPTVGLLLRTPTYRRLVGGFVFYNICTTGFAGWVPTFLMRSHGMQVQHVGPAFGLSYAFGAAAGAVAGALLLQNASWATPQRALRYAGVLMIAALPVFACGLLVSSSYLAIGLFMVYGLLTGAASGPLIAMQQNVVSGQHRALAAALSGFFVGYIGGGLGPLVLGMGSDLLAPSMGVHSLRGTLLAASAAIVVSGAFLLAASRSYVADAAGQGNSTR
jgi:MFS family permease